jgi:putative ABC transport system permease protein
LKKGELNKVLLGHNYQLPEKIFTKAVKISDKVELNERIFEVVGFYEEVGNPQDDSQMYFTIEAMEDMYPEIKERYAYVMMQAQPDIDPNELADKIKKKLRIRRGQEEGKEDFFVQTFADVMETFGNVMTIINGVLVLIALISLVVASVNIMNTMYTAVIERTKEIGVMKAIGARNSDILYIFIFESGFLGAVGGVLGVGLGYLVASAGGNIAAATGYSSIYPIFPWYLTAGCILFAFFIGAIAGIMPALQASKLRPVDALRYE